MEDFKTTLVALGFFACIAFFCGGAWLMSRGYLEAGAVLVLAGGVMWLSGVAGVISMDMEELIEQRRAKSAQPKGEMDDGDFS